MVRTSVPSSSGPDGELERSAWPELDASVIELLRGAGETREIRPGDVLFDIGTLDYDFVYVESGAVDIVDRLDDRVVIQIRAGNFMGELGLLLGQRAIFAAVAAEPGRVLVLPAEELRHLVKTTPEVADAVVSAYAARRRLLMNWGEGGLAIVGSEDDPAAHRLREFASRSKIPHRWVARDDRPAMAELEALCSLPESGAAVVTGQAKVLADPSPRDLAQALGMDLAADTDTVFDVIVVGAGPAGLAASVYAASEGLAVLVVEDTAIGGQAGTSSRIENYLGFPEGIAGAELAYRGEVQAVKFGARIAAPRRAKSLWIEHELFRVELDDGARIQGRTLILANGVRYRRLPVEGLRELEGRGIYYAATELEARVCRDRDVVIVGGGNSAGQAAMFLSRHARRTHIVIRRGELSSTMSSYLSERILADPRIQLWPHHEVSAVSGERVLGSVVLRHNQTGEETTLGARALFLMVGAAPNTDWLAGQVALDEKGFVLTGRQAAEGLDSFETSQPGIYAVGDIRSGSVKRVASAVGEGSVVISSVHRHLAR